MFIAKNTYLQTDTDFNALLFNQIALIAVSIPILKEMPISVIALFIVFAVGRVALIRFGVKGLAKWQLVLMLLLVIAVVFLQVGSFIGLQGGMAFLLLLCALKSYEGFTRRDRQSSMLPMIFLLAGAVLFDQSLLVGLWVFFCLMLIATSMAILNEIQFKDAIKYSILATLLTILPMTLLFISMPRRSSPLWGLPQNPTQQSTTGLSETMKPGSIGELVQSNEPAFSATFADGFTPRQQDLYWRVMIMAERNGRGEWQAMRGDIDDTQPENKRVVNYQIVMEDEKGRIPALDYPTGKQGRGIMREAGSLLRVYSRQGVRGINLSASITDTLPHRLRSDEHKRYTHINKNQNPRTTALAEQLWQQHQGNTEAFAQATYDYFTQQKFAYTLKPPILTSTSSTDEFLFQTKQGFCEHYADAFVTIMRSAGIPARVVTGYQGGEWNEQGNFWQIRSKDAHAWAEVWLPEKNAWKRIDPTAAVSISRISSGLDNALPSEEINELVSNLSLWSRISDQSQIYWQRWVVNFDNEQQKNLFSLFGFSQVNSQTILAVLLFGSLPALIPLWLWWRRTRREDISPLSDGFLLLKRRLLGHDYPNLHALGANELMQQLADENRLSPDLAQLLQQYIQLNYASAQAPSLSAARRWYAQARRLSRKHRLKQAA